MSSLLNVKLIFYEIWEKKRHLVILLSDSSLKVKWVVPSENLTSGMCSEGPDQPAHLGSLIRVFTACWQNPSLLHNVWMESKGPNEIVCMHRMIWICTFPPCLKPLFHLKWPKCPLQQAKGWSIGLAPGYRQEKQCSDTIFSISSKSIWLSYS